VKREVVSAECQGPQLRVASCRLCTTRSFSARCERCEMPCSLALQPSELDRARPTSAPAPSPRCPDCGTRFLEHGDPLCRSESALPALIYTFDRSAAREAASPDGGGGRRGSTAPKAPHRRGGEGGAFRSGRAGAESQWGLGAGARLSIQELPSGGAHVVYLIHRMPNISTLPDAPSPGQSRSLIRPRGRSLQR
jgi:hypothetical protein